MTAIPELPSGVWQHYKGPLYLVLGYGHDSNIEGRPVVVYVGLELDGAKQGPRLAVRNVVDGHDAWFDMMHEYPSGLMRVCANQELCGISPENHRQRFVYLGPEFTYKPVTP